MATGKIHYTEKYLFNALLLEYFTNTLISVAFQGREVWQSGTRLGSLSGGYLFLEQKHTVKNPDSENKLDPASNVESETRQEKTYVSLPRTNENVSINNVKHICNL